MDMNKVYTLISPFPATDSVRCALNGRLFMIRRDQENGHLHFFDALTQEALIESSTFDQDIWHEDGTRSITTHSGTCYHIIPVPRLLPTQITEPVDEPTGGEVGMTSIFKTLAQQIVETATDAD